MSKKIKLNQILAIEKGLKSHGYGDFTKIHQSLQKAEPLSGISRTYRPIKEDGEKFPSESTQVQIRVKDVIKDAQEKLTELFDVVATKDFANCNAIADIVVDADTEAPITLMKSVPVSHLLWLEKQLNDLYTFVKGIPVLASSEIWHWDDSQNCYSTNPFDTSKSKKVPHVLVKYEATKEHPAQVEVVNEDELVGYWTTVKFSGALPSRDIESFKERVQKLQKAVKFAREQANSVETEQIKIGEKILGFVFNNANS
jgi:hypothetical protein